MLSLRAGRQWLMSWMLGGTALLAGCGLAEQEAQAPQVEQSTAAVIDCKPVTGAVTICGTVTNANGIPLGGALVQLGTSTAVAQADGSFTVSAAVPPGASYSIIAQGHMPYVGSVSGDELGTRYVLHTLHRQTFQTGAGVVSVLDPRSGAGVQLDLAALVTASGAAPTPPLTVGTRYIDTRLLAMPGNDGAVNLSGRRVFLESRGAIYTEVRDARGNLLRLRPGANARVNIPITNDMVASAPGGIALWSMPVGTNTNQWRQQPSTATNTTNPTKPTCGGGEQPVSCNADDCSRISGRSYTGNTNEIGFVNADIEKDNPACLAINVDLATLPPGTPLPICLTVEIPAGTGVQTRQICSDGGTDVLFNLPPNATLTVRQAGGLGCPPPPNTSVLVNSGAPWGGTGVPPSGAPCAQLNIPPLP